MNNNLNIVNIEEYIEQIKDSATIRELKKFSITISELMKEVEEDKKTLFEATEIITDEFYEVVEVQYKTTSISSAV